MSGHSLRAVRAVAFDGFGTTVYVATPRRAFQRVCEIAGLSFSSVSMSEPIDFLSFARKCGISDLGLLESLLQDLREEAASVTPYPDVVHTFQWLRSRGIRVAVASNVTSDFTHALRMALEEHVDVMYLSSEVGCAKPDQEYFHVV